MKRLEKAPALEFDVPSARYNRRLLRAGGFFGSAYLIHHPCVAIDRMVNLVGSRRSAFGALALVFLEQALAQADVFRGNFQQLVVG